MPITSAGIALYRRVPEGIEIFLVHPGGPFWKQKDDGAWTFPKGQFMADEQPLAAARREFREETGLDVDGDFLPLGTVRQSGGKIVHLWAVEGDFDVTTIRSNTFFTEWPPKSGRQQEFPEVDRAGWFSPNDAKRKLIRVQAQFVDRLLEALRIGRSP